MPRLERFQAFLRLAVAAGPLLGLIGTVIGMIITFQSITESGSSDPRLMANGIGQAMIATVLGLGIAVPLLFVNAGLASMSRQIVQILDEQSTGLLAESLERHSARGARSMPESRARSAAAGRSSRVTDLVDGGRPLRLLDLPLRLRDVDAGDRALLVLLARPAARRRRRRCELAGARRAPLLVRAPDPPRDDLARQHRR